MQSAWPFLDSRFALPVAALLVPFALEGVLDAGSRLVPARPALPALALGALLLLPNAHRLFTQVLPRAHRDRPAASPGEHEPAGFTDTWAWSDGQYRQAAAPLASWLHACDLVRTGALEGLPEGHVMVSNPRIGALLTGRRAVQARGDLAPAALAALAREKGVALVLVDNFAGPPSVALRRWRDAGAGDLRSLLRLPGDVEILGVE